ncbi:MAG TPA: hypothetical protein VH234_03935 [Candidatus Saccharimonadales bacterium]|jgi:hypothetical protein|nr:hypothetical protein [Candidatus Saccharimonadales bacterium]
MLNNSTAALLRYSICVSGAAAGDTVKTAADLARATGQAIAESGHILTTGATVGLPYYAAVGAREAGGMSIGFSPAVSLREHLRKYRLPSNCFDFINFTGLHYVGRDLYLVQSSDAVITIGGRFGSLHEFTSALEAHKPCGILTGSGGTADQIPKLMEALEPPVDDLVIYDDNPERLVKRIVAILDEKYADLRKHLESEDQSWFLEGEPPTPHAG